MEKCTDSERITSKSFACTNYRNAFFGKISGDEDCLKTPTIIPALSHVAIRHCCITYTGCIIVLDTRVHELDVKRVKKFVDVWINCCI
jgi:hypothetical protein